MKSVLSIPVAAATNPWTNAVRPPAPVDLDDLALLAYVRTDNDHGADGTPRFPSTLGYTPDCNFAPDRDGWDRDAPFPGMF